MTKESTSFGLDPEQVRHLLKIGEDTKRSKRRMSEAEKKEEMLHRLLSGTLPLEKSQIDMLPAVLGQLCRTLGLLAGESIISLVQNPAADISLIERIKQYGRELSDHAHSEDEREVATVIYFAAIANALMFHKSKISKLSYEKLESAFLRLMKEAWISSELRVLFSNVHKLCKEKAKS
jgi:hypothetical protein